MEGLGMQPLFPNDRVVCLTGTENFREVGGYPTEGGRRLRRGLIWRSARLDALTREDAEILNALGIRLVADLRRASERAESSPDRVWPGEDVRVVWWDDLSAAAPAALADLQHDHGDGEVYRAVVHRYYELMAEAHVHRLRDLYCAIADGDLPVLIHCAAGKDRTGFAVALLLKLLGIRHEYVLEDYAASERLIDWERPSTVAAMATIHPKARALLNRSDALYLQAALDRIELTHGSVLAFAKAQLSLSDRTIENLHTRLLES
jgi:protein-tyrosine phosphatase